MNEAVSDFLKGFFGRHVDWQTRHCSEAYDLGYTASMIAICCVPVIVVFAGGYFAGRYWP